MFYFRMFFATSNREPSRHSFTGASYGFKSVDWDRRVD